LIRLHTSSISSWGTSYILKLRSYSFSNSTKRSE
jgi:hypothetical protein